MSVSRDEVLRWVFSRQVDEKQSLTGYNRIAREINASVRRVRSWNPLCTVDDNHYGSIFNFDFSSDGSLLVAACERKSILLFDPFNGNLIQAKNNAHSDCVNYVRFLDSRTFATCSDDTTVCLWDVRCLKNKIRTLQGHSNWVKNIEYAQNLGLLMTSGFDGCIYTWDINRYSEQDHAHCRRVFHTNGLVRSRLSPDASKLIMSTLGGYLMIVHDLDLTRLPDDLAGFKPNMYRRMQMSCTQPRLGYAYNHLFTRKKNRVELVSDFPSQDNAEMISSLEVHPQGWCVCSRNTTNDESSEWTCVHDIQGTRDDFLYQEEAADGFVRDPQPPLDSLKENILPQPSSSPRYPGPVTTCPNPEHSRAHRDPDGENSASRGSRFTISINLMPPSPQSSSSTSSPSETADEQEQKSDSEDDTASSDSHNSGDVPLSTDVNNSVQENSVSRTSVGRIDPPPSSRPPQSLSLSFSTNSIPLNSGNSVFFLRSINHDGHSVYTNDYTIRQNVPRLKHYIEEPNVGRGFIKELCFSSDGRLICSPFGYGFRLLAFDPECHELCDNLPDSPVQLHELASNMSHSREVVTCKFSPTHCLIVSGCLNGKVDFHQPVL